MGDGDGVDFVPLFCFGEVGEGVVEGLVNDGEDGFEMGAGGDFGDDAAIGFKDVDLGDDDIAQNIVAVLYNGGGGFVATTFDA